ncbi:MAG: endonuclease/exonuclease/phosphatase family protein [Capnocytophaga sp.]|nr:endonuclease/exonuclease/phosphatase family protein [Capnocytophaga sp.]
MKHLLSYFALLLSFFVSAQSVSVMSFNIRYDNDRDGINAWTKGNRKTKVETTIRDANPDILCVQEALHHQITFLENAFPRYTRIGVGRDDAHEKGEYAAIFFDKNKYKLLDSGTFWLSPTPDAPSKGWDATCCNRICTWVKLQQGKKIFYVFNAHFDHEGKTAQLESAKLISQRIAPLIESKIAVILAGDFNVTPDSEAIKVLKELLNDSYKSHPEIPKGTFTAFDTNRIPETRIDYIFVSKNLKTKNFTINHRRIEDLYPSDHYPVQTTVKLR